MQRIASHHNQGLGQITSPPLMEFLEAEEDAGIPRERGTATIRCFPAVRRHFRPISPDVPWSWPNFPYPGSQEVSCRRESEGGSCPFSTANKSPCTLNKRFRRPRRASARDSARFQRLLPILAHRKYPASRIGGRLVSSFTSVDKCRRTLTLQARRPRRRACRRHPP